MDAARQIDIAIAQLTDWRGEVMKKLRLLIHTTDPEIVEEWKWNTPVFSHNGQVCALGSFSDHVKINFFKGASIIDLNGLFNSGLEAKTSRAIDIFEHDIIDEGAISVLIKQAVAANLKTKNTTDTKKAK